MCRSAEEIRKTDFTCIALDEYIQHRKKSVNGDKESLAYFDVLRAEAQIENRIVTIMTREDMLQRFSGVSKQIGTVSKKVGACKTDIDGLSGKLQGHIDECALEEKNNPKVKTIMRDQPLKFWGWVTGIMSLYFVLLHIVQLWIGLDGMLKALLNQIPGVNIP